MMISFDNPVWWFLAAAPVPLLVHLVARTRPKERRFSSVVLLQELVGLQSRHARPQDIILLVLRTLLCLSLALAFLLPYYGGSREGEGGRALVLVLDDTASMGAADGQLVRMNAALGAAQSIVQNLAPNDRFNLATLAGYSHFIFDKPESARPLILRELARTQSRAAAAGDVRETLTAALTQVRNLPEEVQGQVLLISDFQTSGMKSALDALEIRDSEFCCVNVAQTSSVENTSVAAMRMTPAKPLPGQKVTLRVELRHYQGAAPRRGTVPLNVSLSAGNVRLSHPCELTCGSNSVVQFELVAPETPGDWLLSAGIEPDSYSGDNVRHLVVPVADKLDCVTIAADRAHLGFMQRALENTPFLRTLHLPAIPENRADFVVWHAPGADDVAAIQRRLAAGETVLIVPDMQKDAALTPLLKGEQGYLSGETRTDGESWQVSKGDINDDSFSLFDENALAQELQKAGMYSRLGADIQKLLPPSAKVLLSYRDSVPALVRVPMGCSNLLIWNMPVTARYSRLGFSPMFLPLLAEQFLHARSGTNDSELIAGRDFLLFELPLGVEPSTVRLLAEDGSELPVKSYAAQLQSEQPALPGVYRWVAGDTVLHTVAVNFPATESDLQTFTPSVNAPVMEARAATDNSAFTGRIPLWPWLLASALLFFMMELLICRRPVAKKNHIFS